MLADEFNDIPIKPQINITNSTTVKIRFITVLAFLALFFEQQIPTSSTHYCLLMVHERISNPA